MKTNMNNEFQENSSNNENFQELDESVILKGTVDRVYYNNDINNSDNNNSGNNKTNTNNNNNANTNNKNSNKNQNTSFNSVSSNGSNKLEKRKGYFVKHILTLSSIFIGFCIVICTLALAGSIFLKSTVFSTGFYQKVTTSPNYIPMLKSAIEQDLSAQSSFVAIPVENLKAGLDDIQIEDSLRMHVVNVLKFLDGDDDFVKSDYPADLFYKPLEEFIKADGKTQKYIPSKEQYDLLKKVSEDSAIIVEKHVNIISVDTLINISKNKSAVESFQRALKASKNAGLPAFGIILLLIALLFILHKKNIGRAVLFSFTSLWIAGTLMLFPSIVLEIFGMTRRMAINTAYIKFAVDTWLTYSNRYFLVAGSILFVISSIVLILRIIISKPSDHITTVVNEEQIDEVIREL